MSVALTLAQAKVQGPPIDWAGLSPLLALFGGATIVLLVGLLRARVAREVLVPVLALASFGTAIGLRHLAARRALEPHLRRDAPRRADASS